MDHFTTQSAKNRMYYILNIIFMIFQISFDNFMSFMSLSIPKLT